MKRNLSLLLFVLIAHCVNAQTYKALFLGNSYTASNSLPQLVADIASSQGDSLIWDWNTPGGYTLEGHSTNLQSINLIKSEKWDFVVLQDQSQRPAFPLSQVALEVYPFAADLDSIINENWACTEPMFFMTWGRKYGDQVNCPFYPPICTFEGMQGRLRHSYLEMARDNNASVAPAGMAWKHAWYADSTINLWSGDYSHPSYEGSYLTACVFYASMFRKSPLGAFNGNLPASTALFLQHVAHTTVFDSIGQWLGNGELTFSEFDHATNGLTVQFGDSSLNAQAWNWYFGDGTQSANQHPVHTYSAHGQYLVDLEVQSQCFSHIRQDTIVLIPTYTDNIGNGQSGLRIWPQPANNHLILDGFSSKVLVSIYSMEGKLLVSLNGIDEKQALDVSWLDSGRYILTISGDNEVLQTPIIILR